MRSIFYLFPIYHLKNNQYFTKTGSFPVPEPVDTCPGCKCRGVQVRIGILLMLS